MPTTDNIAKKAPSTAEKFYKADNLGLEDFRNKSPFREKNVFSLSDINYSSTKKQKYNGQPEQKMIIREFQPNYRFNWYEEAVKSVSLATDALASAGSSLIESLAGTGVPGAQIAKQLKDKGGAVAEDVFGKGVKLKSENHMDELIRNLSSAGSNDIWKEKILDTPVDQVKRMLSGVETAYFEMPFYGDEFLMNQQSSFWSAANDLKEVLDDGGSLAKILKNSSAVNFPTTPTWNPDGGGGTPEPVQMELTLYNNNLPNLIRNYKFVHGLMQGVYWSQIGNFQKSSNLYDITVPGRFRYFFCTMEAQIRYAGKTRVLNADSVSDFMSNFSGKSDLNNTIKTEPLNQGVIENTHFPDAYNILLTFKSLMPNNYNMYIQYFITGDEALKSDALSTQSENIIRGTVNEVTSRLASVGSALLNSQAPVTGSPTGFIGFPGF